MKKVVAVFLSFVIGLFLGWFTVGALMFHKLPVFNSDLLLPALVVIISFALCIQGIITSAWMLYAWDNPEDVDKHKSPTRYSSPHYSFTALLPARKEKRVIADTINAISNIDYP